MFDSEPRNRITAATPGRDAKALDRRSVKADTSDLRAIDPCPAHRWVEARRAHRAAPARRLPAFVKT